MEIKERRTDQYTGMIHCESCGEDYSATYKKCPFCSGKTARGGKRLSDGDSGGTRLASQLGDKLAGAEPVRIIGLILSLILIIAAIYILFTALSPLLHKGGSISAVSGSGVSSAGTFGASESAAVSSSAPAPDGSGAFSLSGEASSVITPLVHAESIRLDTADVTLKSGEAFTLKATILPSDSDDEILWTSSDESVATVTVGGTVTNVNQGASSAVATITATAGETSAVCTVRCAPLSTAAPQPQGSTTPAPATSPANPTAVNRTGTVTGTTTGLLVRSGPGRENEAQDTLLNDSEVIVLEDTGTGWYKINYSGNGGKTQTGYASKDYITVR